MAEPYMGEIRMVGFNFAPRGWTLCDGQLLPIAQNTALFSLFGTTYGGDGRTTFGLPALRSRTPVHVGTGAGLTQISWGEKAGREYVTLTANELPNHNHQIKIPINSEEPDADDLDGAYLSNREMDHFASSASPGANAAAFNSGNVGGGQQFSIRNPFLGIYFCVALVGIYPSRS